MVLKIAFFAVSVASTLLVSCIGEDPNAKTDDFENSVAMCTDGDDNDGDFNYDCYDPDCRALDSTRRSNGDSVICHYDQYRETIDREQSSFVRSSAIIPSSSSVAVSNSSAGFPFLIFGDDNDTVQVLSLFRKKGSARIILTGRMRQHGLYGIMDTTGKVMESVEDLRSAQNPPASMATGAGSMTGTVTVGIDTTSTGDYTIFGSSQYANREYATFFSREGNTGAWNIEFWWKQEFVFTGFISNSSKCFLTNSLDTAFMVVDMDLEDNSIPYPSIHPLKTHFVAGALAGEECAGVGTRTSGDTTQIWYGRLNKNNDVLRDTIVSTGSIHEVAHGVAVSGTSTYIAARIDGEPRLLVVDADGELTNNGASQNLGVGEPSRLRVIQVGSTKRILMLGSRAGKGMLWLFGTDGGLVGSAAINSVQGFSDAIQLGDGNLLISGWAANENGSGTVGVVEKVSTSLTLVE